MTLTSTVIKDQFNGTGAQTEFPTSFVFWDADDLDVILTDASGVETSWERGTQYAVSGGDGATGTVTVSTNPTDYTPASGERLTIKSALPNTQPTSLPAGGPFPSASVEQRFDQNVRLIQQLAEEVTRTIQLAVTSTSNGVIVPDPEASRFLRWDPAADNLENADISAAGSIGIPVTIAEGGTEATTAAGARTSLGLEIGSDVHAAMEVPSQAEAEAGTATTERVWTAQRVAQAVAALVTPSTLPKNYLTGLQLSNDTDADHDISVSAGECRGSDDDEDITLSAAMVKRIDSTWAAGSAAGGLSSSLTAPANNTWYHVHAIMVGGSADVGFDTSSTAANLVADHTATAYRRLGSVLTDGSANLIAFRQDGDEFSWLDPSGDIGLDHTGDPGASVVATTLTVPSGVSVRANLIAWANFGSGAGNTVYSTAIYHPDVTAPTPSAHPTIFNRAASGEVAQFGTGSVFYICTNTSAQVHHISHANVTAVEILTTGWIDDRGRNG